MLIALKRCNSVLFLNLIFFAPLDRYTSTIPHNVFKLYTNSIVRSLLKTHSNEKDYPFDFCLPQTFNKIELFYVYADFVF